MTVHLPLENIFPNLKIEGYILISPRSWDYNCIAFAADDQTKNWWPVFGYWPPNVPNDLSINSFVAAYETLGYEKCEDGNLELGYEKVALYVDSNNEPTHAAKQLSNGKWKSKLGKEEDIEHNTVNALISDAYGTVAIYLRRKIK